MDDCELCGNLKEVKWVHRDATIPISFPLCVECRKSNVDNMVRSILSLEKNKNKDESTVRTDVRKHYGLE